MVEMGVSKGGFLICRGGGVLCFRGRKGEVPILQS